MGNVLRILKRDILRLFKAPAALIVAGALLILPSFYTWYNVVAFWDPYGSTGDLKVCVVNLDAGSQSELTGELNVGDRVTEELLANERLDFETEGLEDAMGDLVSGKTYAVYVIPYDFTECLISPLTGQVKTPQIEYYTNEKLGPVSPKITDNAANTLDQTINSMFVETVSDAATRAIDGAIEQAEADISSARSDASQRMSAVNASIIDVHEDLEGMQTALDEAQAKADEANAAMANASTLTADAQTVLNDVTAEADAVQASLTSASSSAISSLSTALLEISDATSKASTVADSFLADAGSAQADIVLAVSKAVPVIDAMNDLSADLQEAADALSDDWPDAKAKLAQASQDMAGRASEFQSLVDGATALSDRIVDTAQIASDAAQGMKDSSQRATDALQTYSSDLYGDAAPTINSSVANVSSACAKLSTAISNLGTTVDEAQLAVKQLSDVLGSCREAVTQTDGLVLDLKSDLGSVTADFRLLSQSDIISDLVENGTLNSSAISEFMGSPTQLETVKLYHPNSYGTAMAPLFMNLTFWIGAFMLVIIFKLGVDDEGLKRVTSGQRYFGRFLLLCGIAVGQALICCAGVLALGVQVANVPALFVAAAFCSLAYCSIIFALSKTLQHIGKALCIILVFAQIPGGSGLYPLELTSDFFQTIYPFLPFSYGINAMREAICGFYGNTYGFCLAVLALIFVGTAIVGRLLVPIMSNVIRMAARQIRDGDLYNGEDVVAPARPFRFSQVVSALSDSQNYREDLERRYAVFSKRYPGFIRAAIVLGIVVPTVLGILLALDAGEKAALLTIVLVWLVALVVFVLFVESYRYSFERQLNIERMTGEGLLRVFLDRDRMVTVSDSSMSSVSTHELAPLHVPLGASSRDADNSKTEEVGDA